MGQDRWTAAICLAVVAGQVAMAALMGHLGIGHWWLSLIVALVASILLFVIALGGR